MNESNGTHADVKQLKP